MCVAAGNAETDPHVLGEVGRIAGTRLRGFLQTGCTLAVTGGSTIREVAFAVPQGTTMNVMVVPARGGMGGALETQANTLACEIARRLGGQLQGPAHVVLVVHGGPPFFHNSLI